MLATAIYFILAFVLISVGIFSPNLTMFILGIILYAVTAFKKDDSKLHFIFTYIVPIILFLTIFTGTSLLNKKKPVVEAQVQTSIIHNEYKEEASSIYITPHGKRYHHSPTCGGKNSAQTTLDQAISDGYTPCMKCVD